ncbi:MAG: rhomboid family intramembrane serine protease [Sedimentisphaerales bacterium]|nr:rhomboid family intramembrane serine protease [Sedimentisphaerales bacterium]
MSFQDRQYYGQQQRYGGGGSGMGGGVRLAMPSLTPMVKYLLIINGLVFLLQMMMPGQLEEYFAAMGQPRLYLLQVWRLVTFQFLHGSGMHILFNMLGLYFLGVMVERTWGSKRFLVFYLVCGAVGGALFEIANAAGLFGFSTLVGASGGVLGLLVACAIMYPGVKVLLFFVVPVPIRVIAVGITFIYFANVLRHIAGGGQRGDNAGGDLCHLGGIVTSFGWVMLRYYGRRLSGKVGMKLRQSKQVKAHARTMQLDREVDRILEKVQKEGLQSLTRSEKATLQRATEEQKRTTNRH